MTIRAMQLSDALEPLGQDEASMDIKRSRETIPEPRNNLTRNEKSRTCSALLSPLQMPATARTSWREPHLCVSSHGSLQMSLAVSLIIFASLTLSSKTQNFCLPNPL